MHTSSFHSAHSSMPNVCDNNVYVHGSNVTFILLVDQVVLISVQDDMALWKYFKLKDELPEPRGSLANNIPSCAIEQANQEVQQGDHHSQHVTNA